MVAAPSPVLRQNPWCLKDFFSELCLLVFLKDEPGLFAHLVPLDSRWHLVRLEVLGSAAPAIFLPQACLANLPAKIFLGCSKPLQKQLFLQLPGVGHRIKRSLAPLAPRAAGGDPFGFA